MKILSSLCVLLVLCAARPHAMQEMPPLHVSVAVDAAQKQGEMRPVWRYFGYDEPNYTYMKGGKKTAVGVRRA